LILNNIDFYFKPLSLIARAAKDRQEPITVDLAMQVFDDHYSLDQAKYPEYYQKIRAVVEDYLQKNPQINQELK